MKNPLSAIIVTNAAELVPLQVFIARYVHQWAAGDDSTSRAKRNDLSHFVAFLMQNVAPLTSLSIWDLSPELLRRWISQLLEREKPTTVARRLATVKHMLLFARRHVPAFGDWISIVKAPSIQKPAPRWMPGDTTKRILVASNFGKNDFERTRNRFVVHCLFLTGMRPGELLAIKMSQLNFELRKFSQVRCKGNQFRDVALPAPLLPILGEYILQRKALLDKSGVKAGGDSPLVVTDALRAKRGPMNYRTLNRIFHETAKRAGLVGLTPHQGRHTYAHNLYEQTKDLMVVKAACGHRSATSSERYVEAHMDDVVREIELNAENIRKRIYDEEDEAA